MGERETIARTIDPVLFDKYDKYSAEGRRAENGRLWADVCYGDEIAAVLLKADAIMGSRGHAQSPLPSPVAWFCFVDSPPGDDEPIRIRAWTTSKARAVSIGATIGREFQPLYDHPPLRAPEAADAYRSAVDDEMALCNIGGTTGDARKDIRAVIEWNIQVALDPRVSKEAAGAKDARIASLLADIELLEKNAGIQAKLLADTKRAADAGDICTGCGGAEYIGDAESPCPECNAADAGAVAPFGYVVLNKHGEPTFFTPRDRARADKAFLDYGSRFVTVYASPTDAGMREALVFSKAAMLRTRTASIAGCNEGYGNPKLWADELFASHADLTRAIKLCDAAITTLPSTDGNTATGGGS
jgi:hypothetical protein